MGYELAYMSKKSLDDDQVFRGAGRLENVAWIIAFFGSVSGIVLLLSGIDECNGGNSCSNLEKYYAESQITDGILLLAFTWILFVVSFTAAGYFRSQIKYQNSNLNLQSEINDKLSQIMNLPEGNGSSEPKRLDPTPSEQSSEGAIPYSEDQYLSYKERERDLKSWTQDMLNKRDDDD